MIIEKPTNDNNSISKYDRRRGGLQDVAMFTRPSTIKNVETMSGRAETFVVESCRYEDGDYIFVECIDDAAITTRLCLPPKVANVIASQRESLTRRSRSQAARRNARERMDRGELPGFLRKKK